MQDKYLGTMDEKFSAPIVKMPLFAEEIQGIDMLKEAGEKLFGEKINYEEAKNVS